MHVSVVVPTYRRPDLLARCLAALARQRFPTEEYEVIVADDANDDATRRHIESLDLAPLRLRYVAVTNRHGPAAARNLGWREATAEIIAFTDDDCIPGSGWLAAGTAPFVDPAVIAVTGQTIVPLPPDPTDYERNTAGLEESEFITANCFCRREALKSVDGFDERFTTAWREDSDLHFRLLDTGGTIVRVPAAVVVHPVRPAGWGVSLREQRKSRFDALLFRKHRHHFRQRIQPTWPWQYYLIVLSAATAISAGFERAYAVAFLAAIVWLILSLRFCLRRLERTSHSPRHVAEMVVTSLLIPFLSVWWRLYGAVRYGVFFW